MAMTLRVSPWEYSAISKNAADKTEAEFIGWMLEKWPILHDHLYEKIEVVVDKEDGSAPFVWGTILPSAYILSIHRKK